MSASTSQPRIDLRFAKRELQDGLTAVAVQNPGVPTLTIGASMHVNQIDEAPDEHGLAAFTGAALEEGTVERGAVELAEAVESLGGALSTLSSGARISCPATARDGAAALLSEVVMQPGFRDDDVERVRREILSEIETDEEEPSTVAAQRYRREIYGDDHPFGRPAYGDRAAIERYKVEDLRRFHDQHMRPERGIVVLAGPFELDESLDTLAASFAGLAGPTPARPAVDAPAMPAATRHVHLPMEREQVHIFLGHPGIARSHPDFHALLVMDYVLGTGPGFTARIPKRLRDEQGLCYSVGATITGSAGEHAGTFRAYIGTSAEHREKAVEGFLAEMRLIQGAAPSADEVQVAQDYLAGSFVLGLERNANLANYAIRAERLGYGFDYLQRFPDLVRAVTVEDVQRVAREHLDPEHVVVVSAGAGTA